ncbi:hypothetical protein DB347_17930 [Opitutaceae bacterium EW11]|nr:hypothetical protein DB347_17930 [Opitutaceae bacterium EW11]
MKDKGGVGASFNLVLLALYLDSKGVPYQPVDADLKSATLSDSITKKQVIQVDFDRVDKKGRRQFDFILDLSYEHETLLVDLPAGSTSDFIPWSKTVDLGEQLQAEGLRIVLLCPVSSERDTLDDLLLITKGMETPEGNLSTDVGWIVTKSDHKGPLTAFENSKTRLRLTDAGADEIFTPELEPLIMEPLRAHRLNVSDAIEQMPGWPREKRLSTSDLIRLKKWRAGIFAQYDTARNLQHLLVPAP